ncbi:MAG TPA: hypothetical protein VE912_03400 [Bacteroidales bacterium]|nr:hypothetical protein [Bacteroidales bacterium]
MCETLVINNKTFNSTMKNNYPFILTIAAAIIFITSCKKDNEIIPKEELPSTAEWTYIDGSGYSSSGTTYVKIRK